MGSRFFKNYEAYRITSDYGEARSHGRHEGVDLVAVAKNGGALSDYIIAFDGGEVTEAGYNSVSGYFCKIKHCDVFSTVYCHMKSGTLRVKKGDIVARGDVLGYMGSTGNSTGAHLHIGLYKNGKTTDPKPYFDSDLTRGDVVRIATEKQRLRRGSRGDEVRFLQALLAFRGFETDIDGVFGVNTQTSVKNFQRSNGFSEDGVVGELTWGALLS